MYIHLLFNVETKFGVKKIKILGQKIRVKMTLMYRKPKKKFLCIYINNGG